MLQGIEYAKQQAEYWGHEADRYFALANVVNNQIEAFNGDGGFLCKYSRNVSAAAWAAFHKHCRYQHCVDVYERCKQHWDNKEPDPMEFGNDIPW